jgi:ATP-binding cassette subfamily B protein
MSSVALGAMAGGLPPLFIKRIVDHAIPGHRTTELALLCAGMVLGPMLQGLLGVGYKYLAAWISEQVMYDLRLELFAHVQRQSLRFYDRNPVGRLVTRVVADVEALSELLTSGLDAIF